MKIFRPLILMACLFFTSTLFAADAFDYSSLRQIPILDQGRVKPLDTFARESVRAITGQVNFEGKDPVETLISWISKPESAMNSYILLSRYEPLNQKMGFKVEKGRLAPKTLAENKEFQPYLKNVFAKEQAGESMSETEKEAALVYRRLEMLLKILAGSSLQIFPDPTQAGGWASLDNTALKSQVEMFRKLLDAFDAKKYEIFNLDSKGLAISLRNLGSTSDKYPSEKNIQREVKFNNLHPFRIAWILFAISFVLILLSMGLKQSWLYYSALILSFAGVGISIYGFVLRCLIAGRPPVSNMYESVIWVSFGAMIFALIFEAIYKSRYFVLAASALSAIGLVLADNLPNVLNASIQPLVPVLRSNFWLTIHVLTITLSYAALMLSMGIGQVALGFYAFKPQAKETIKALDLFVYRCIQVGVVLLAAGTILGGVWANYSWGRFWGWDPKEVWALIALLGYIAILHGRYAGWLRSFGLTAWSVLAFLLVMMAWYGVNFVLGVGLHSYGFSSGGFKEVAAFIFLMFAWVGFATWRYKRRA